jgi:hypothetical protein
VSGGSKGYSLPRITKVRGDVVVGVEKRSEVYKVLGKGNGARTASHGTSMPDLYAASSEHVHKSPPVTVDVVLYSPKFTTG